MRVDAGGLVGILKKDDYFNLRQRKPCFFCKSEQIRPIKSLSPTVKAESSENENTLVTADFDSNTFVFEGKTLLSDFYKILRLDDEIFSEVEGDADSLAGLLLEIKGDFPELNERIDYLNFTFEILEMEERRISKVKVIVHQPSSDQPTA